MAAIKITNSDVHPDSDGRFSRFELIEWWDQKLLREAKILVIGAGALGNEIIKNLALLGIGNVFIADLDRVENSNLSRSVLFRASDNGRAKAEAAAEAALHIYPDINVGWFAGDVIHDLGMGVFRWADIVIGGLDNREARLAVNRYCYKVGRPWIDGAIESIQGMVRVFTPDSPCYECTMTEGDWRILQKRRSCNLLTQAEMETGKTPTTPTVSSIIAGIQCQEAVKMLHALDSQAGIGWYFNGIGLDSYQVEYQFKDDCLSHDPLDDVISLDAGVGDICIEELLARAKQDLGRKASLELGREMLERLICPKCGYSEDFFTSIGKMTFDQAYCPHCHDVVREVIPFYIINENMPFLQKSFARIGVPPLDIIIGRNKERSIGYEFSGDASSVLGPAYDSGLELL